MTDTGIKLLVTCIYLGVMLLIGFYYYKKNDSYEDYVLGGRKLGKWTTAISAQASDMSGWLLLGLPGAAYLGGIEAGWIAIGLFLGTYGNWLFVAKRLRIYTEIVGNSLTLSDYFERRFEDNSKFLRVIPSVVIIVFFTVYTAAQFSTGAKLFELLMGLDYQFALVLGSCVIIGYTLLGGFMAVSTTDLVQGILMFFALLIVPVVAITQFGGVSNVVELLNGVDPHFLDFFKSTGGSGSTIAIITIITNLAWGLGYCGQPHILTRFMAIEKPSEIKQSRRIAIVWVFVSLFAAVVVGVVGRAVYDPSQIADSEKIFMLMVDGLFPAVIGGMLLAAILAASMSTADSQLLVTATSMSEDFYKSLINKKATNKELMNVGKLSVLIVSVVALFIAWNPESSVFGLVSYAWAGLGASFGPVVAISLFWQGMNKYGAMAGVASGAIVVIIWEIAAKMEGAPLIFSLYSILPAVIVASILIVVVSKATKGPSESVLAKHRAFEKRLLIK